MKETTKLILIEYQMAGACYLAVYSAGLLFSGVTGASWPFIVSFWVNVLLFVLWTRLLNYTDKEVKEYRRYCRDRGVEPK